MPTARAEDRLVTLLSHWLARHASDNELRRGIESIGTAGFDDEQAGAVEELRAELENGAERRPGELERLVRETLEAVALGS